MRIGKSDHQAIIDNYASSGSRLSWKNYHKSVRINVLLISTPRRCSLVLVFAGTAITGSLRFLFGLLLGAPVCVTFRIVVVLIIIRAICSLFTAGNSRRGSPDAEAIFKVRGVLVG